MGTRRQLSTDVVTQIEDGPSAPPGIRGVGAQLTILSGVHIGRVFHLQQSEITLGRGSEATIRLKYSSVSRLHATIRALPGGDYEIEDLRSRNGTRVSGHSIHGRCLLRSGDRIELGVRVLVQFSIAGKHARQLQEAEKLQTIGLLAASVNHDFNNVLTVMACAVSYMEALDGQTTLSAPEVQECFEDLRVATKTAAELTARLGVMIHRGEHALHERVNVSEICREVSVLLSRILPKTILIESAFEPNLVVDGSRAWIHQLLMNPCVNARDAMPRGGVLRIEARRAVEHELLGNRELASGPHLVITVSDTGAGMAPEVAAQAFDPLFTTKPSGSGTGLGLATVARVAREHGGTAAIESVLGKGTTVRILLPLGNADGPAISERPTLAPKVSGPPAPAESWRILLVDDDAAIVRSVARLLTRSGHEVIEAADGVQALERFRRGPRPHVVVMDVDMPVMNGRACLVELLALDKDVKVIFVSGYIDADVEQELRSVGACAFLRKPLDLGQLATAIEDAVGGRAPAVT